MISRRHFTQTTLALAATPALAVGPVRAAPGLTRDSIAVAVIQSRGQDIAGELDAVLTAGRKDLVCFPALQSVDVNALRQAAAYVAVNDMLITPGGEVLSGQSVYETDIGRIGFTSTLNAASLDVSSLDPAHDADMLIHLNAGPVSFMIAQTLAKRRSAHVIAATPVGDSFLQASGSVIFSPAGELLAAAGVAWTQTVAATLHIGHWRSARLSPLST